MASSTSPIPGSAVKYTNVWHREGTRTQSSHCSLGREICEDLKLSKNKNEIDTLSPIRVEPGRFARDSIHTLMNKKSTTYHSGPARRILSTRHSSATAGRRWIGEGGFLGPRVLVAILICMGIACSIVTATLSTTAGKLALRHDTPAKASQRTLTFAERVSYQRAIEEVYWRHRIWPKENPYPKPSLDAVMTQAQLEEKVQDYLRKSQALQHYWRRPITADPLQAEMDRMAQHTKQPEVLHELFEALGNDPYIIAECLARPLLAERLLTHSASEQAKQTSRTYEQFVPATGNYSLPSVSDVGGCTDDTWTATSLTNVPEARSDHKAVWTGTEMIVWGGNDGDGLLSTGGRYNPSTDSWAATSTANAPTAAGTAVWTGSEMIIWGGDYLNTGGRYNPGTDTWIATGTTNAPNGRDEHTAVWTGTEMIVWGGMDVSFSYLNTGGRYNPGTDSWTATSATNAPSGRILHTALWTGSQMIVWGGSNGPDLNTGGKYNPGTDSWAATSATSAPSPRDGHTAVWTGFEMIVWAGHAPGAVLNTGGRYQPGTDSWAATSITNAPTARDRHTAVWTGSEMIVWGGANLLPSEGYFNTGGRYNPTTETWTATGIANAPLARHGHTAVWTGSEMIVWGGAHGNGSLFLNTGRRYCAQPPAVLSQLGNISTRAFVQTGENVMIGGFIVQGSQTKRVIIRAIGPELAQHGVPNPLFNPTLELHDGRGALIASNDDWHRTIIGGIITSDQWVDIINSGHAPSDGRESAIIADLPPGNYTAIVRGVNNMTGVALVEAYDLSSEANSILGDISTRSFVETGDNVMIGGFIIEGTHPQRVIIRAIGPELSAPPFNIPDALADPTLELHDHTGALIASNDNWQHTIIGGIITSDQVHDIMDSGHAPTDPRESAIIATLPPGNYTAIVRGVDNTTGVALVEVYDLQ
jgi:N-acetylneuraminic acid mutarotase